MAGQAIHKPSQKALSRAMRRLEASRQSLIANSDERSQRRYRKDRDQVIDLARAAGLPEYGLEAEREAERYAKQSARRKSAQRREQNAIKDEAGNKVRVKRIRRPAHVSDKTNPEGFYHWCRSNGYTHETALLKTAERFGQ